MYCFHDSTYFLVHLFSVFCPEITTGIIRGGSEPFHSISRLIKWMKTDGSLLPGQVQNAVLILYDAGADTGQIDSRRTVAALRTVAAQSLLPVIRAADQIQKIILQG